MEFLTTIFTGAGEHSAHGGAGLLFLELAGLLVAARLGGHFAERLEQPAVLGELLTGVFIAGVLSQWLPQSMTSNLLRTANDPEAPLSALASMGAVLLLFGVGLESRLGDLLKVGGSSLAVAVIGMIVPILFGWGVCHLFDYPAPPGVDPDALYLFIGAALAPTSVGITARVLEDLHKVRSKEARVILGAALIDDVLTLVLLGMITGLVYSSGGEGGGGVLEAGASAIFRAFIFMVVVMAVGLWVMPIYYRVVASLQGQGSMLAAALAHCFIFAFLAEFFGLAAIVGAFMAGMLLEEAHRRAHKHSPSSADAAFNRIQIALAPLSRMLVPIFFVVMGLQVQLDTLGDPRALVYALALTLVAILGKQACALVVRGSVASRMAIGVGMVPRGEVGLVFGAIGLNSGLIDARTFSAIVFMVLATTLITPPLLKWIMIHVDEEAAN